MDDHQKHWLKTPKEVKGKKPCEKCEPQKYSTFLVFMLYLTIGILAFNLAVVWYQEGQTEVSDNEIMGFAQSLENKTYDERVDLTINYLSDHEQSFDTLNIDDKTLIIWDNHIIDVSNGTCPSWSSFDGWLYQRFGGQT